MILLLLMAADVQVEARALAKASTLTLAAEGVWLDRFDLRGSPGGAATLTHYLLETVAVDYLSVAGFYTLDLPAAARLRNETGFEIDQGRPQALATAGVRYSFAYAKALLEHTQTVFHFAPEITAHVGALFTSRGVAPAATLGLALRVHTTAGLVLLAEYRVMFSIEQRFVVGGMPMLGVGWMF